MRARTEQRRADHEESRVGIHLVGAQVQGGAAEHVPKAFDGFVGDPQPSEQSAERLALARLRSAQARQGQRDSGSVPERQVLVPEERR